MQRHNVQHDYMSRHNDCKHASSTDLVTFTLHKLQIRMCQACVTYCECGVEPLHGGVVGQLGVDLAMQHGIMDLVIQQFDAAQQPAALICQLVHEVSCWPIGAFIAHLQQA